MQEPRLAEMEAGDLEEFYREPSMETLQKTAGYLESMERIEELVEDYKKKRKNLGKAEALLEEGYDEDEHVGYVQIEDEEADDYTLLEEFVIGDRIEKTEEDLTYIKRELVKEVNEMRAWDEEVEATDGPVRAASVTYGVVMDTFSTSSDAEEALRELREEDYDAYQKLDSYAEERNTARKDEDALDRFIDRDGIFQREDLFGLVADIVIQGVDVIDEKYADLEEKGQAFGQVSSERRDLRHDGDEPVKPWSYEVGMVLDEEQDGAADGHPDEDDDTVGRMFA
ncbi:MAG: hypothetical protein SV186_01765 [Candidatus Nanohaloarchaea archaeon]|nr:hypothetical protein [Candidatus Nanohaloarchaea archaeon]